MAGYQNLLMYLHTKRLTFCRTPVNRRGVDQMMSMVVDPDSPNDILKVNVNEATGDGGDDWVDTLRYGCMSRPMQKVMPVSPMDRINQLRYAKANPEERPAFGKYVNPKPAYLTGDTRMKTETIT